MLSLSAIILEAYRYKSKSAQFNNFLSDDFQVPILFQYLPNNLSLAVLICSSHI